MSHPPCDSWHLKPLERPIHEAKWIKMAGPGCDVSPGNVRPHFWVYVIRVLDSIFSSCQILLTFQSCVAQLSIIFSLPRLSCTSKGGFFFYSGMLLLLLPEKCALYRLGF